jgi:Immunity protein 8
MKAKLKSWYCPDIDDLSNYSPPQFDNFCMLFTVMVGPAEKEGYESFDIQVCTPKWLECNIKKNGFICGRHFLIVLEFEYESLINKIRNLIESCEGKNWDEVAQKVSRIGYWEFEDYNENM